MNKLNKGVKTRQCLMQHSAKSMGINVTGLQMQLLCSLDCHVMYICEESVV